MKTDLFIEKIEQKYCWQCSLYKKPKKGSKKNFEIVCEENMRLNSMPLHRDIKLNYIDRKTMVCSAFNRESKPGNK